MHSDIKGQCKCPLQDASFWYLMSQTFWKQPLGGRSSKQDFSMGTGCERIHGLLSFMCLEKLQGKKKPQSLKKTLWWLNKHTRTKNRSNYEASEFSGLQCWVITEQRFSHIDPGTQITFLFLHVFRSSIRHLKIQTLLQSHRAQLGASYILFKVT